MNTNNYPDFLGKQKPEFKIDGQRIFLTYPRNQTTKEEAMNRLKDFYKDELDYAIVSIEDHKEENVDNTLDASHKHLHVIFKLKNRVQYGKKQSSIFDFIADKHGNYSGVREEHNAIKYTIKDGNYITYNIDTKKYLITKKEKGPTKTTKGIFQQIAEEITATTEYGDILSKYPAFCLQHAPKVKQHIRDIKEASRPKFRDWDMNVSYLYGKSGTGKSKEAHKEYNPETHYKLGRPQGGHIWFCGYTGQETIIIDDFSHRDYSLTYMLELLDRYAMPVQYKGGQTQMLAKNIIITSNYEPDALYTGVDNPEHRNAFLRRIKTFKHFTEHETIEYNNIQEIRNTRSLFDTNTSITTQEYDEEDEYYDNDSHEDDINEDNEEYTITTKETKQIDQYRCHICAETFRTEQYLKLHNRREHKETWMPNIKTDKDISKNKKNNKSPRLPASSAREK